MQEVRQCNSLWNLLISDLPESKSPEEDEVRIVIRNEASKRVEKG